MENKPLIICDLDNTLYDWYGYFVPSIYEMIDVAADVLGCETEEVAASMRVVHQRHHDSEHPFALLETDLVASRFPNSSPSELYEEFNSAFHAFNRSRVAHLKLFEGVVETLSSLNAIGLRVVAHTESKLFGAIDRVNRLGLEPYLTRIYCREETLSNHPVKGAFGEWLPEFNWTKVVRLPLSDVKPNARIIHDICSAEGFDAKDVVYVGDSLARDVMMAKHAGSFAVWAKYGAQPAPELYEKLVRISHWTAEDVEREKAIRSQAASVKPDFICHRFADVMLAVDASCNRSSSRSFWIA